MAASSVSIRSIVEEIGGNGEVVLGLERKISTVADKIFNPKRVIRLLSLSQCDHSSREIDPDGTCCPVVLQEPRVESFSAGDIDDVLAGKITD